MIAAVPYLIDKKREITSIQFIIQIKGRRLRFVPGIKIETKFWIDNNKWCKENKQYPDGYLNNVQIKKYKDIIEQILEDFQKELIIPTQETFKKAVIDRIDKINLHVGGVISESKQSELDRIEETQLFIPFAQKFKEASTLSKSRKEGYQTTINKLISYQDAKNEELKSLNKCPDFKLKFENIDMSFYNDFTNYLVSQNLSKNYIGSFIKDILRFMEEAKEQKIFKFEKPKGFIVSKEDSDNIALSETEIRKIHDIEFTEELVKEFFPDIYKQNMMRKIKSLNIERDRFLIGYCTALRISDYSRIDEYNIEDNLIAIWTKKKDKKVYIPIHHYLKEIIDKYQGLKLPKISDQKHNEQLKDICKISKINELTRKTITKGGKRIEEIKPKYELVSSHTARRSGATNMYRNGIDLLYISRLLGHSKIEQTVKYLKITTKELANSMKDNPYFSGQKKAPIK
ncbi:MAG: tyrosine-type recombinase/integrase [Prevotella sp.]|jgi:integrase|nr:tyrosine-type recombinase/integrase [Prevotella sp.]